MKIYVATDHAGFALKEALVPFLKELGHEVEDCGAFELDSADDYPELIAGAASRVSADAANGTECRGIILGKSGQGEAMAANRFPHVRAAVYYGHEPSILTLSREHNDANILSLAGGFLSEDEAKDAVRTWLETPFSGEERHAYRIGKLDEIAKDASMLEKHSDE
ncbi:MAG TPA: RpiB/LacA/LacB family sugar-phosphate isomerase [Candidatus Paceibacterota bacterium]|nr:RpiB/LacA/LacB family sugar-phosphate isomerase [Candidatus Paceibacterota bacterium]